MAPFIGSRLQRNSSARMKGALSVHPSPGTPADSAAGGEAGVMPDQSLTAPPRVRRALPTLLLLLTVFGPISMDLYLPALPALTADLGAVTSVAQLTVTACLIGLAAGQLIAGPLSDRFGRRGILLIGIAAVHRHFCALRDQSHGGAADRREVRAGTRRWRGDRHRPSRRPRHLHRRGFDPLLRATHGRRRVRGDHRPAPRRPAQLVHRLARTVRLPRSDRCRHPRRDLAGVPRDPSGRQTARAAGSGRRCTTIGLSCQIECSWEQC